MVDGEASSDLQMPNSIIHDLSPCTKLTVFFAQALSRIVKQ